jgi:hypothetical protein
MVHLTDGPVPAKALEVLQAEAQLPICRACATQYPAGPTAGKRCVICEDPRQFVPASGQEWTSLADLTTQGRVNSLHPDAEDSRITLIHCDPGFGISQTRERPPHIPPPHCRACPARRSVGSHFANGDSVPARDGRRIVYLGMRGFHLSAARCTPVVAQNAFKSNGRLPSSCQLAKPLLLLAPS